MPNEDSNRLAPRPVATCRNLSAAVSSMCFVPCRGCRICRSEPRLKYATVYRVAAKPSTGQRLAPGQWLYSCMPMCMPDRPLILIPNRLRGEKTGSNDPGSTTSTSKDVHGRLFLCLDFSKYEGLRVSEGFPSFLSSSRFGSPKMVCPAPWC